jgi:hypothetical protein
VPDIHHAVYAAEVKTRKTVPTWLRRAMAQAVAAQRGAQLPIVVLHETGTRLTDDLVVVRFGDLPRPEGEDAA